jgi:flagellar assembly protein FliH
MKVVPFSFRDLSEGEITRAIVAREFIPSGRTEDPQQPEEVAPVAPTFSEEDLKNAEREAYKKGFLEGKKEGNIEAQNEQAAIDKQLLEKVDGFVGQIYPLFYSYQAMAMTLRQEMPKVALAVARKVAGEALDNNAQAVIEALSLSCLQHMIKEPKFCITVHTSLSATLEKKMGELAASKPDLPVIQVLGNEQLNIADCKIEWAGGTMERNMHTMWQQVEGIISQMSDVAVKEANEELVQLAQTLPAPATIEQPEQNIEPPIVKE